MMIIKGKNKPENDKQDIDVNNKEPLKKNKPVQEKQQETKQATNTTPKVLFNATPSAIATLLFPLILIIAVLLLYLPANQYPLVDNAGAIINNSMLDTYSQDLQNPNNFTKTESITKLAMVIIYKLFGAAPFNYRIANLILHIINMLLLFLLVQSILFNTSLYENNLKITSSFTGMSFFVALFFGIHPLAVYAVANPIEINIVLATTFSLLSFFCFTKGYLNNRPGFIVLSVFIYGFALYAGERSIFIPFVILLLFFILKPVIKPKLSSVVLVLLLFFIGLFDYSFSKLSTLPLFREPWLHQLLTQLSPNMANTLININPDSPQYHMSLLEQAWLFFRYTFLVFIPDLKQMAFHIPTVTPKSWVSWPHSFGLLLFISYPAIPFFLLFKKGFKALIGLALFIPWVLFIPELAITQNLEQAFYLGKFYLPLIGFCMFLLSFLIFFPYRIKWIIIFCYCLIMGLTAFNRVQTFQSPLVLWNDTGNKISLDQYASQTAHKPFFELGNELVRLGKYDRAIAAFEKSVKIEPLLTPGYYNLGLSHMQIGQYHKAITALLKASSLSPKNYKIYFQISNAYLALKDYKLASNFYKMSSDLNTIHLESHFGEGVALYHLNKLDLAKKKFLKLIKINPKDGKSYSYLARIAMAENTKKTKPKKKKIWHKKSQVKKDTAKELIWEYLLKTHENLPKDTWALFEMAKIKWNESEREEAIMYLQRAISINPQFEKAQKLLDDIIMMKGPKETKTNPSNKHRAKQK